MIVYMTRAWLGTLWSGAISGTRIVLVLSRFWWAVLLISADGRRVHYAKRSWRCPVSGAWPTPKWVLEIVWDL